MTGEPACAGTVRLRAVRVAVPFPEADGVRQISLIELSFPAHCGLYWLDLAGVGLKPSFA